MEQKKFIGSDDHKFLFPIDKKEWGGVVGSSGYDGNAGFYMPYEDYVKLEPSPSPYKSEYWIPFPEDIREKLSNLTIAEFNWVKRLKFLFTGKL